MSSEKYKYIYIIYNNITRYTHVTIIISNDFKYYDE